MDLNHLCEKMITAKEGFVVSSILFPEVEPFLPLTGHDAAKVSRGAQTVTPHANSFVRGTALIKNNRDPLAEKRQQAQQVADADDGQDVWPV